MAVRFLVISDHHLGRTYHSVNRGYAPAWALERVLDAIAAHRCHDADFLLSTGDLVDEGVDEEYAFAHHLFGVRSNGMAPGPLPLQRRGLEGLPLYLVPGNHDPRDTWLRSLFPGTPPAPRLDLEWQAAGQDFIYLDLGTSGRAGALLDSSLERLDRALERGSRPVLVLHHHPIEVGIPWIDRALPAGVDRLWSRVAGGRIRALLFGHAHVSLDATVYGIPVLATRSTCFQFAVSQEPEFVIKPLHYRVVTVDGEAVHTQLYEVPLTGEPLATEIGPRHK
ncbi:MAG: metallophosphoesterase [Trueperaceae bacterium]